MRLMKTAELLARLAPYRRVGGVQCCTTSNLLSLALSDCHLQKSEPYAVVPYSFNRHRMISAADALHRICEEHQVGGLLFCLELGPNDSSSNNAEATREFVTYLQQEYHHVAPQIPAAFWGCRSDEQPIAALSIFQDARKQQAHKAGELYPPHTCRDLEEMYELSSHPAATASRNLQLFLDSACGLRTVPCT
mmetsp:Transcript_42427/g.81067  ORF Transcript_42427/g.81067 Transcript_42427/m.81067 type:complete len:192 (+) Transcript_42427:139-714(+)|eukprot:CAMPEP_0114236846 /NCGR_PEP_ID=MMETSP0058-20121206/7069_1 /TAXON_ID=36894 /ORGANISM="Pyramimonas parkeae, CCMP726" /LENGTH=191 /DNA_ID=CAMNT_0001348837 /DNA_START=129 /DNA_END=704 /DNA_ORIENTATION=-